MSWKTWGIGVIALLAAACTKEGEQRAPSGQASKPTPEPVDPRPGKAETREEAQARLEAEVRANLPPSLEVERLEHGSDSLEGVARNVLAALEQDDADAVIDQCVGQAEYRSMYPFLALSPGGSKIPVEVSWLGVHEDSKDGISAALDRYGGESLELVDVEVQRVVDNRDIRIHLKPTFVVRTPQGEQKRQLLTAILEHPASGTFKALSFQ